VSAASAEEVIEVVNSAFADELAASAWRPWTVDDSVRMRFELVAIRTEDAAHALPRVLIGFLDASVPPEQRFEWVDLVVMYLDGFDVYFHRDRRLLRSLDENKVNAIIAWLEFIAARQGHEIMEGILELSVRSALDYWRARARELARDRPAG